jgi:hypothetical protein
MKIAGRYRNLPCFCGSGRKLKHCCARRLGPVRTEKVGAHHWRFWRAGGEDEAYASELCEHVCGQERFWIARGTVAGTSWVIDGQPATLFEVLDCLPGGFYGWAVAQTAGALGDAAPTARAADTHAGPGDQETTDETFAEIRGLLAELLRLALASDALSACPSASRSSVATDEQAARPPLRLAS